jgi:hypothetical protein
MLTRKRVCACVRGGCKTGYKRVPTGSLRVFLTWASRRSTPVALSRSLALAPARSLSFVRDVFSGPLPRRGRSANGPITVPRIRRPESSNMAVYMTGYCSSFSSISSSVFLIVLTLGAFPSMPMRKIFSTYRCTGPRTSLVPSF